MQTSSSELICLACHCISAIVTTAGTTGTVATGVRQAGGIIIIVMKGVVTGYITSQLRHHRRVTGTMSTGTKVRRQVTGMMVLRGTGAKDLRQDAGNA